MKDIIRGGESKELFVSFMKEPSGLLDKLNFLLESCLQEGQWDKADNKHLLRRDHRPIDQGGDQVHVRRCDGRQWAYKYDGSRSEPNKYTSPATNDVKDIVAKEFNIDRSLIERVVVVTADKEEMEIEVHFL